MTHTQVQNWSFGYISTLNLDFEPVYQRNDRIWPKERKEKLIHSLLDRNIIIPMIYLRKVIRNNSVAYEVVDGKQRLSTIAEYRANEFGIYFNGKKDVKYSELPLEARDTIDTRTLYVVVYENTTVNDARNIFKLLQYGAKTNAQEDRNASGGFMHNRVIELSEHKLFGLVSFTDKRYGFQQVSAQMLKLALNDGEPTNISKTALDAMYQLEEATAMALIDNATIKAVNVLDFLAIAFDGEERTTGLGKGTTISLFILVAELMHKYNLEGTEEAFKYAFVRFWDAYKQSNANNHLDNVNMSRYDNYLGSGADTQKSLEQRHEILINEFSEYIQQLT